MGFLMLASPDEQRGPLPESGLEQGLVFIAMHMINTNPSELKFLFVHPHPGHPTTPLLGVQTEAGSELSRLTEQNIFFEGTGTVVSEGRLCEKPA